MRYEPVAAESNLCIAACIKMVLNYELPKVPISQAELAVQLGEVVHATSESWKVGTKIDLDRWRTIPTIGRFFQGADYVRSNTFPEWEMEGRIEQPLSCSSHLILTLSAGRLYSHADRDRGHSVLVESIEGSRVCVVDPGPETFGIAEYAAEDIYWATRVREGGIIVIPSIRHAC